MKRARRAEGKKATLPFSTVNPDSRRQIARVCKPPFGYYGAKQRLAGQIINSLPPHNAWVEACCGSAAITLAKSPAPIEVINDQHDQIVNLFDQLRDNAKALCRAVSLTPYSRAEFQRALKRDEDIGPLERARRFLVATMMTINGTNGTNCGFSFSQSYVRSGREARVNRWYNLPQRLEEVAERLRNIRIENRDARELVEMFSDRPATLVYLDPPYFVRRDHKYVIDANDEEFHVQLLEICCKARCMILISGYDTKLYRSVLTHASGWTTKSITARVRGTNGTDQPRVELLWMNRYFVKAQKTGKVPIRLTPKEREEGKLNPARKR